MPADRQRSRPVPSSTYRIQFSKDQTFDQVRDLLPYLDALGAGALYASPLLESGAGSNHGYDVVDPTRISAERGGPEGLRALVAAVREHGLGFVLDIVPNHVGVAGSRENPWWWDVLRHGKESAYATYFDIDWDAGPILLPVLDADEEKALSELALSDDGTELHYYEHAAPVAPGTEGGTAQEVHERQRYRFGSWKRGAAELTYRRFFDVSTLAAVRVEDPEVFAATHAEILRWVDEGAVDGLRVDHPDGLSDPGGYARRLRAAIGPDRWLVVEKILGVGEALPASWPVDGTSGYEALREIQGVFVDPDGAGLLTQFAAEHTGRRESLHAAEHTARREVADTILAAEVRRIAALAPGDRGRRTRPRGRRRAALRLPRVPLLPPGGPGGARRRRVGGPHPPPRPRRRARRALRRDARRPARRAGHPRAADLRHGDGQGRRGHHVLPVEPVRRAQRGRRRARPLRRLPRRVPRRGSPERDAARPATMTTLSTHDTKRSEDVRARLAVLAEMPREWTDCVRRWSARHPLPERSLELLAWQNLVGAWPIPVDRMAGYLTKASKEAKLVTSHVEAVPEVDEAVAAWPAAVLADAELVAEIEEFVARISAPGWSNSLGQKLLQLAGPGVPDVYQGTDLFEYSLVDPDNRRPVDWAARRDLLTRLDEGWLPDVDAEGAAKLLVTTSALRLRRYRPEVFTGLPPAARRRARRRARRGVPAVVVPGRGGDQAAGRAGRPRRVGRHGARAARRGRRLARRRHRHRRRRGRTPARGAPGPLPGGAARPSGVREDRARG